MKRTIAIILLVLMAMELATGCGKSETPIEDFDYEMVNGEIIITGYHGSDREIVIPKEIEKRPVTQIGEKAFATYDLIAVDFPSTIQIIGESAFSSCDCLESVSFHDKMRRIEQRAFYDCDALVSVNINSTLEYLGYGSFGNCDNLKEIELPDDFSGFATEYKQKIVVDPSIGAYVGEEGDAILDPVLSGGTVLVVTEGSNAHNLLLVGAWFDEISYVVK